MAIVMTEAELSLIDKEFDHPERFLMVTPTGSVYKWMGTNADLKELAIALHNAGLVRKTTGEELAFKEMVSSLEQHFNIKIPDIYERKARIMARKKNIAPLLEKLLNAYREAVQKSYQ